MGEICYMKDQEMTGEELGNIVRANYAKKAQIYTELDKFVATCPEYLSRDLQYAIAHAKEQADQAEMDDNREAFTAFRDAQLATKEFKSPPDSDAEFRKSFNKAFDKEFEKEYDGGCDGDIFGKNWKGLWKDVGKYWEHIDEVFKDTKKK